MRVFIGWAFSWIFYRIGRRFRHTKKPQPVYNWFMANSVYIQDWGGGSGPWGEPKELL